MGKEDTKVKNVTCFETEHNSGQSHLKSYVIILYWFQIQIELFSELLAWFTVKIKVVTLFHADFNISVIS